MEENLQITVLIAGRAYPMRIAASDEQLVQEIVREVNEKITGFQAQYQNKDKQDCLAMVLLTYALESKIGTKNNKELKDAEKGLKGINMLLDGILNIR